MNITLLSVGTRGDTQPYIALGLALKRRGHRVRIAASESFRGLVEQYGLEYALVHGDVEKIAASDLVQEAGNADNPIRFFMSLRNVKLRQMMIQMQHDLHDACYGADVIVYHPGAPIGYFAAQELKIPSILATPFPMTPTREYPNLLFYHRTRLGRTYNWLTHRIFEQGFWMMVRGTLKEYWESRFGRLPRDFGNPYVKQRSDTHPTVLSCSPEVFPRPSDWPEHVHCSGYWFLDSDPSYQPPSDLRAFLEAGEPPVYVGFGSIADKAKAAATTETVMEALRRAGKRGLLATGWQGMTRPEGHSEDVHFITAAPHEWLFPRMAAVVHHGGAGTTAAGLRSGVPSIVIPFGNDQFAWGQRVYELGVGPKPIPRTQLTSQLLATAIESSQRPAIQHRARVLGEAIRRENGTERTVDAILAAVDKWARR